jgi:HSP20 family protein
MAFFPRYLGYTDPSIEANFTPLFRFLDEFDNYAHSAEASPAVRNRAGSSLLNTFNAKFDVVEKDDNYELHGELPGIDQKDVEIEFTDPQTLSIHGHSERSYTSGTPPAGLLEQTKTAGQIESGEKKASANDNKKEEEPKDKLWVSERSAGDFSRSFHFPTRVNQDAVKATMKNGILSIVVPKAAPGAGSRKIHIA